MKVGIDGLGCDHGKSGHGSYLLSFASSIPQNCGYESEVFGLEEDRYNFTSGKELSFASVGINDNNVSVRRWHAHSFKSFARKHKYDVVIFPAARNVLPSSFGVKGIAVVNSPINTLGFVDGNTKKVIKSLKKIQFIIAASSYVKNSLIAAGIDERKISVIYNGIDHKIFFPDLENGGDFVDVKPFAIKKPYFIFGSRISGPEKKHKELIQAFTLFKKKTGLPHRLVISGEADGFLEEIQKIVYDSPYANEIFFTGYFPHESFSKLYANAEACIFPAINEGSGLPVIEAMACGIPVLCSDSGALPEVGGTAPLYFNSDNIEQIASLMELVVSDESIRKKMVSDGILQAGRFSWEKTVKETLDLLK